MTDEQIRLEIVRAILAHRPQASFATVAVATVELFDVVITGDATPTAPARNYKPIVAPRVDA